MGIHNGQPPPGRTGPELREQAAAILQHPLFPRAARALATTMLAGEHDPALASQFKDAGRYAAAMASLCLHALGGLTLPRLEQACAAVGLASPVRAGLLLQSLHQAGHVERAPPRHKHLPMRYRPTQAFLNAWHGHLHASLLATMLVRPAILPLIERFGEPGVFETFLRVQARRLPRLVRGAAATRSFRHIFLRRRGGLQIIAILLASSEGAGFPSTEPLLLSPRLTAARFGISHLHVGRLLHDAAREGLIAYDTAGMVTLLDDTRETVRLFQATQIAGLAGSAAETLARLVPRPRFIPLALAARP